MSGGALPGGLVPASYETAVRRNDATGHVSAANLLPYEERRLGTRGLWTKVCLVRLGDRLNGDSLREHFWSPPEIRVGRKNSNLNLA